MKHPDMNNYEYDMLKGNRRSQTGTAAAAVFGFCQEFGWLDTLGILTPRGQRAINEYETYYNLSGSEEGSLS